MLHTVLVSADVFGTIDPLLFSMALLDIVSELAFVLGPIYVSVLSVPVGHIVLEFTPVNITLCMPERALAFCLVVGPLTLVMGTVCPILHTVSMPYDGRVVLRSPLTVLAEILLTL